MNLTIDNYHSAEANRAFLSVSQARRFRECEAMTIAELNGWKSCKDESDALLIGSRVDCALLTPDRFAAWDEAHAADMVSAKTQKPYAWVKTSDMLIARAKRDATFMRWLAGDHQVIIIMDLYGAQWKCALDIVDSTVGIEADLKTLPSAEFDEWDAKVGKRLPWYDKYFPQRAVYREAYKVKYGKYPAAQFLFGITKQEPPDLLAVVFNERHETRFAFELDAIQAATPRWLALKAGTEKPTMCGTCEYCRGAKVLTDNDLIEARDWKTENKHFRGLE